MSLKLHASFNFLVCACFVAFVFFQIFAGAFPKNYEPPSGFYFEVNDDSEIVQVNC